MTSDMASAVFLSLLLPTGREISGAAAAAERLRTGAAQLDLHILLRESKSLTKKWAGLTGIAPCMAPADFPHGLLALKRSGAAAAAIRLHELLLECA